MRRNRKGNRYEPELKLKAVELAQKGVDRQEICKGLKINYKSLCQWIRKYEATGYDGLINRVGNRRKARPAALENEVLKTSRENPMMGKSKISGHLRRFGFIKIAVETVGQILKKKAIRDAEAGDTPWTEDLSARSSRKNYRTTRRKIKRNKPKQVRYFERSSPNTLWQMDIMTFMLKGQYRIYLIGVLDDYSRFMVNHGLYRRQTETNVHEVLRGGIEKYGCPKEILTDNGRQFYSWRGKSKFTRFCTKVGIQHIRSRPYHPQTLGKIESFWRNLYQEFLGEVPLSSFEEAQEKIREWIKHYNYKRVHLGIGNMVPSDRYFGVSNQVEELIKEGSEEIKKQLKGNPLEIKPPMYLVGKIGGHEIRVLAKDGEVTINDSEKKAVEGAVENIVESKVEETDKTGGIQAGEKGCLDGDEGLVNPPPAPGEGHKSESVPDLEEGAGDGGAETGERGAGEPGGQVPPDNQRAGEDGADTVGAEEGKDGTGDMRRAEHQQRGVLQVDEGRDGVDEGGAGACGAGQEIGPEPPGEGGTEEAAEGEEDTPERESAVGDEIPGGAEADRVAGRRKKAGGAGG